MSPHRKAAGEKCLNGWTSSDLPYAVVSQACRVCACFHDIQNLLPPIRPPPQASCLNSESSWPQKIRQYPKPFLSVTAYQASQGQRMQRGGVETWHLPCVASCLVARPASLLPKEGRA